MCVCLCVYVWPIYMRIHMCVSICVYICASIHVYVRLICVHQSGQKLHMCV